MHYFNFTSIYQLWQAYRQRLGVRRQLHTVSREACTEVIRQMVCLCDLTGLCRALRQTDPYIRREAVRGISQLDGKLAAPWLVSALHDNDRNVAHAAAECIGHLVDPPITTESDQTTTTTAAHDPLKDSHIYRAFIACQHAEDWMIRFHAASGLARIRATSFEAQRLLEQLANDEHQWVQGMVAQALRRRPLPTPNETVPSVSADDGENNQHREC